ncbi:hypothetical protein CLV30_103149 [Haloactinopolyspora alba]|uniref:ABC transporter n=1 Tax=Haloactinopolyspora alba TaxID=648780 RepID=A0A2P8E956_9ACTN|nr:hypothetical protein [Haloactinopolyspora alba]PSL05995.1 hypothetical protein CLV30_103149 [Haloactinopolyspora alba]
MTRPQLPTRPRNRLTAALTAALALTVAACGTGADGSGSDAGSGSRTAAGEQDGPPDSSRREVDAPRPRLVVAHQNGAAVIDPADGRRLAAFDTTSAPRLTTLGDGRHVALVQADAGRTDFLDAGAWSSAHGDHFHHYVADPALRTSAVDGPRPVHVVSNAGRTAVFHDGSGTAQVFGNDGLLIDSLDASTVDSGGAHHGVVVPLDDGALVSVPGPAELPNGMALVDAGGDVQARFEDCPGLHGETVVDDTAVFGCENGLMLVTGDTSSTIANPDGSGERVGGFAAGSADPLIGDYADDSFAVVDVDAGTFEVVDAGATYGPYAAGPHGRIVALGTDGSLRIIDPAGGSAVATIPVLDPFELPEGHGGLAPSLAVAGHTAYVADPATSTIVPVDLQARSAGEPIALEATPTDLVAVGTAPTH